MKNIVPKHCYQAQIGTYPDGEKIGYMGAGCSSFIILRKNIVQIPHISGVRAISTILGFTNTQNLDNEKMELSYIGSYTPREMIKGSMGQLYQ